MKHILFFTVIFFLIARTSPAQTSFRLIYDVEPLSEKEPSAIGVPEEAYHQSMYWIFNDSVSLQYFDYKRSNPNLKRDKAWGSYYISKASFTRGLDSFVYYTASYSIKPKDGQWEMIRQPRSAVKWHRPAGERQILGYRAKPAVALVRNEGLVDTILVWYTTDIRFGDSYLADFADLDGVPLEISDQRTNDFYQAVKIEESNLPIVFPAEVPVISAEEFEKNIPKTNRPRGRRLHDLPSQYRKNY